MTPGHCNSSISFAASGSNCNDAKIINSGFGTIFWASKIANATWFFSNGEYSGPKEITIIFGSGSFVSPIAWIHFEAGWGSIRENSIFWPPFLLTPVFSISSPQSFCLLLSVVWAIEDSISEFFSNFVSSVFTTGDGTAPTLKVPDTLFLD